ncbi:hypothetical protein OIU77_024931 [Salix suchowensis]|uniref:Mesoderm induction early response protein 1 n=1 Tax=Salix suchowensis TaxID=1278906 RepID=A0ABQ9BW62_9ROSI|nr:hypothetical protein OIU77_024931 [Salix suchowensis]
MEGKNEGEDNPSRGNDWEVVTLTASTYAAAPGPKEVDQKDYESGKASGKAYDEDEDETSRALFMSRHFVLPPSQHENLSLEPVNSEILDSQAGKNVPPELGLEEGGRSSCKNEEIWPLKGLDESEEFHGMQFETALGGSTTYLENLGIPERRMASLYAHAKEANTFWSIFVAAAVMGIVILGQRWQQERWQVIINNERSGRILGPITRLKDVIVGGHRRGSFIRGSTSSGN